MEESNAAVVSLPSFYLDSVASEPSVEPEEPAPEPSLQQVFQTDEEMASYLFLEPSPPPNVEESAPESSLKPVYVAESSPEVWVSPSRSPPCDEPAPLPSPPLEFYPCGYPKPIDPRTSESSSGPKYYETHPQAPCPVATVAPVEKVTPIETVTPVETPEKPAEKPTPNPVAQPTPQDVAQSTIPAALPQNMPPEPQRRFDIYSSEALASKVKNLINSKNITALAELVVQSEDIYGLNMGLRFSDEERDAEIKKTAMRKEDKDVVVLKALAMAALSPEATGRVIQLMVVIATSPDGYQPSQHRALVKSFEEIFSDTELLEQVIESDPQEYLRRRLLCAGCIPMNSYVCAHCWPKKICNAYFWCPATDSSSSNQAARSDQRRSQQPSASGSPNSSPSAGNGGGQRGRSGNENTRSNSQAQNNRRRRRGGRRRAPRRTNSNNNTKNRDTK